MKIFNGAFVIGLSLILSMMSCESADLSEGHDQSNGLLNVTIQIPNNAAEYSAEKKGPYTENEEIIIKVPTTDEEPLDLTKLICTLSLENNCYASPAMDGEVDFTNPVVITVKDALGKIHTNTIRIVPVPPKTKFALLWNKSAVDLKFSSRNITGVAMNEKYLAAQEYNGPIYLYDKKSGDFIKTIDAASSFMMKIDVDDAGHFVTSRENIYGAGFMVYYYSESENVHKLLLDYTAESGCPSDLGYEMSVIGNVTKGKAFIYGLAPDDMYIYYWQLEDGNLITPANKPNKIRYGAAGGSWDRAQIQRASLDDDSEHYISYYRPSSSDANDEGAVSKQGSRFDIFSSAMEITQMNALSHLYKILDFKVFNVDNDQYVVLNEQGYSPWANSKIQVFDITNRTLMELKPTDEGYDKYCLFNGDEIAPTNYNRWGDIAVFKEATVTGYNIYISASIVGWDVNESRIRMYKMSYYRQ